MRELSITARTQRTQSVAAIFFAYFAAFAVKNHTTAEHDKSAKLPYAISTQMKRYIYLNFELLRSRVEIEATYDTFKNVLNADRSYMRDDSAMEGWMFVNFICLLLCYKVYGLLVSKDALSKCSLRDVILHLSSVFNVKIGDNWRISEVPKKTRLLIEKLGIEPCIT